MGPLDKDADQHLSGAFKQAVATLRCNPDDTRNASRERLWNNMPPEANGLDCSPSAADAKQSNRFIGFRQPLRTRCGHRMREGGYLNHKLLILLAAPQGFEPRYADPESAVLQLAAAPDMSRLCHIYLYSQGHL